MDDLIERTISAFSSRPVPIGTLVSLAKEIHLFDMQTSPKGTYRAPFQRAQFTLKDTIQQDLMSCIVFDPNNCGLEEVIFCVGIKMRLHLAQPSDIEVVAKKITDTSIKTLGVDFLFEACNNLQAQREWSKLALCAKEGIQKASGSTNIQSLFCDWLVLSSYKALVPAFTKNQLLPAHLDDFEKQTMSATAALPNSSKNRIFYRAVVANLRKDIDLAVELTLQAQKAEGYVIGLFQRLECFVDPMTIADTKSETLTKLHDSCRHNFVHKHSDKPVLLISTDLSYFDKYFAKLLESYGYWNAGCLLHLHCVGFQPSHAQLTALEEQHDVKINYTVDRQEIIPAGNKNFNGYCAGARYIHLPFYLEHYGRIIITDIDGVIRSDLSKAWRGDMNAILLTGKIAIPNWQSARLMWEIIAAGSFGITKTPANEQFSTVLSNYICTQISSLDSTDIPFFCTDQIGLLLSYLRHKEQCVFDLCRGIYAQGGNWRFSEQGGKRIAQEKANFRKK